VRRVLEGDGSVQWVCVRRQVCTVGLSKETGLCGGCVEGDRSVGRVCGRRQVCGAGVWKEIGLCSWCVWR